MNEATHNSAFVTEIARVGSFQLGSKFPRGNHGVSQANTCVETPHDLSGRDQTHNWTTRDETSDKVCVVSRWHDPLEFDIVEWNKKSKCQSKCRMIRCDNAMFVQGPRDRCQRN